MVSVGVVCVPSAGGGGGVDGAGAGVGGGASVVCVWPEPSCGSCAGWPVPSSVVADESSAGSVETSEPSAGAGAGVGGRASVVEVVTTSVGVVTVGWAAGFSVALVGSVLLTARDT